MLNIFYVAQYYPTHLKVFRRESDSSIFVATRPKASGSSSRFQTGTRQGKDRDKSGASQTRKRQVQDKGGGVWGGEVREL